MRVGFFLMHPYSKRLTQSLATSVRVEELALSLIKKGVEVYVLTPYDFNYITPEGINVVQVGHFLGKMPFNLSLRVKFYELTRKIYHNKPYHNLMLKLLSENTLVERNPIAEHVLRICHNYRIDVLHSVQDNAALMLLGIKPRLKIPLLLDLTGVWLEEALANGLIFPNSPEYHILKSIEKMILENVDMITVIGEEMAKYVVTEFGVPSTKVKIILQGARPLKGKIKNKRLIDNPRIVYSGILSYRKNVKLLMDSIPYVLSKHPNVLFLIAKKGDLLSHFEKMAKYIKNVKFFFFSQREKYMMFLQSCDVGLITNIASKANSIDMPSKLFEYIAAGLPVVTNETGGWTDMVKKYDIGIVTKSNPKEFAEGINFLIENPEERVRMGKRARQLIDEIFNWDRSAEHLYNIYLNLTQ